MAFTVLNKESGQLLAEVGRVRLRHNKQFKNIYRSRFADLIKRGYCGTILISNNNNNSSFNANLAKYGPISHIQILDHKQAITFRRFIGTHRTSPVKRPSFPASYQPYVRNLPTGNLSISQEEQELLRGSARVVWGAVIVNAANFLAKTIAWIYTGSHSMFAESVHSLADTANQLILAVGIRKSLQSPTADHPYGYHPMRYIAPLISGVGIFCVGCGLSIYHGFEALMTKEPELFISPMWAYGILAFSLLSESTTLIIAIKALRHGARRSNLKIRDYIAQNCDPGVIVVLSEDLAAVCGIGIAATCMALSSHYNTHVFDAVGSLIIGSLLGCVATFIIKKNTIALVGRSIPRATLSNINRIIEKDVLIRAIHDVKATDLGNGVVRYKAEVDVDGRELSRKYLEKIDLKELLEDIRDIKCEKDAETFVLVHGEGVVDLLGAEVDRIEKELRRNHPQVKHVDLEVL